MRKSLLVTAAATAVVACTTFAVAQNAGGEGQPGKSEMQGGESHGMKPGGASAPHAQKPGAAVKTGGSAQTEMPKGPTERQGAKTGQSEQHMGQDNRAAQDKDRNAQDKERNEHMGEGASPNSTIPQRGAQENGKPNATVNEHADQKGGSSRGASVQLTQEQRTKIRGIIGHSNVARVNDVNFSISVGTVVPRSVHVTVLPEDVVEIVPEYRGFDYIVVGDQLLIIDPNSLAIVAVIPA